MAVTLPAFLAMYEWLYHGVPLNSLRRLGRWLLADGRTVFVIGLLTLLVAAGRATGENTLIAIGSYRPVFSWDRFMETSRTFLNGLIFAPDTHVLSSAAVLLIWSALFAIAWATRCRPLKFAWLFLMLSPIPLAFIEPRAVSQYYVVYFGWVLYAATALVKGVKRSWLNCLGEQSSRRRDP